eukprot:TRINITY_DN1163_c0_g2_i1.p4 TRINITY_DN1163_c0_g2~~TRINITY_DN1163_c0_g2_i1.p4  ORF type:complete len:190 (-),score=29.67 TRINITY_DN1163_c0_g2_i1:629-1198(-)
MLRKKKNTSQDDTEQLDQNSQNFQNPIFKFQDSTQEIQNRSFLENSIDAYIEKEKKLPLLEFEQTEQGEKEINSTLKIQQSLTGQNLQKEIITPLDLRNIQDNVIKFRSQAIDVSPSGINFQQQKFSSMRADETNSCTDKNFEEIDKNFQTENLIKDDQRQTFEQWPDFGCEGIKVQRAHQPTSQCYYL